MHDGKGSHPKWSHEPNIYIYSYFQVSDEGFSGFEWCVNGNLMDI
jgi:hypothetical protein